MTGFIQRDEEGWTVNPYTKRPMQKTSTYTITHYLKCQSTHDLYVPTCMVGSASTRSRAYQRWYNYKTDEAVNDSVLYLASIVAVSIATDSLWATASTSMGATAASLITT